MPSIVHSRASSPARLVTWLAATASLVALLAPAILLGPYGEGPARAATALVAALSPPTTGPIVDHFRPPQKRFGPGNLGLDYATASGDPVVAAGSGEVEFAGQVGGPLHVVVRHPNGLRTSYSFLATVAVSRGDAVVAGQVLGTSAGRFHFGVRAGDTYLDPEPLLAGPLGHVRLTPVEQRRDSIAAAIAHLGAGLVGRIADVGSIGRAVSDLAESGVEAARSTLATLAPLERFTSIARGLWSWVNDECTDPSIPVPVGGLGSDVVVEVAGIGSSSRVGGGIERLDLDALGVDRSSVVRFSYAGGRIESSAVAPDLAALAVSAYSGRDSQSDLDTSAARLAELVGAIHATRPGARVHVVAHSQGGVVAVRSLPLVAASGPAPWLDVVTIAAPHQGDTVATALAAVSSNRLVEGILDAAEAAGNASGVLPGIEHDATSARQLARTSSFMSRYRATLIPPGIRVTSIGGRTDVVVPGLDTRLAGARNVIVAGSLAPQGAHTQLVGDRETTVEVARALHGQAPTCQGLLDTVVDLTASEAIRTAETLAISAITGPSSPIPRP